MKGKTDTNGYQFEQLNIIRSSSVWTSKKNSLKVFDKPFERFAYPFEIH